MREQFKPIPEHKNYEVSNYGNVRNVKTGQNLNPSYNRKNKNYCVGLKGGLKYKTYTIHVLVAMAFLDFVPVDSRKRVFHIDENTANNRVDNLRIKS